MNAVSQLTENIALLKNKLWLYEKQLQDVQLNCVHHYVEKSAYQTCSKCLHVESLHY